MSNRDEVFALQGDLPPFNPEEERAILEAARRLRDAWAGYKRAEQFAKEHAQVFGWDIPVGIDATWAVVPFEDHLLYTVTGRDTDDPDNCPDFSVVKLYEFSDFLGGRTRDAKTEYAEMLREDEGIDGR